MERQEWRERHFIDAAGQLPDRRSSRRRGVEDLLALENCAAQFGHGLDDALKRGRAPLYGTFPALLDAIDPNRTIGTVARKRIDGAHKLDLAGALCSIESLVYSDVQPPAGVTVSAWTRTTTLPVGTPGVVVLENGVCTKTDLVASVVGGEERTAYALPVLIEPAADPTNVRALALQSVKFARCTRALVRHYAPEAGGVRIGSLPILLGRIRAAGVHPVLGGIHSDPVAMGDLPEIIDLLSLLTEQQIPYIVQACYGPEGKAAVPKGWYLDLTLPTDSDADSVPDLSGLGELRRNRILDVLIGEREAVDARVVERVPDTAGIAWRTNGSMLALGLRGSVPFTAVGHVSLEGRPTVALTNLPRSSAGMIRLSLGLEGLAGSADARAKCRDRMSSFLGHVPLPTPSFHTARRIFGIIVMSYRWTVVDRCSVDPKGGVE